jgi:uncharacterized protein (DUF2164 family)
MKTLKEEYLDINIFDPLTRKEISVRFIPTELYDYYYNHGYELLFEIIEEEEITELVKIIE